MTASLALTPSQAMFMQAHRERRARIAAHAKPEALPQQCKVETTKPEKLLAAIEATVPKPPEPAPAASTPLPPIPNETFAEAAEIAFPSWVNVAKKVQHVVCKDYNVSRMELLSLRRTQNLVRPRMVAMYLTKKLSQKSLPEIGRQFNGRDHTTVLHALRKIERLMESDAALRARIHALAESLGGTIE